MTEAERELLESKRRGHALFMIGSKRLHVNFEIPDYKWAYFGKANTHTANDNTSGVITIIEAACNMPEEFRDRVCFILFDNEEKGLLGSKALAKKYKNIKQNKLVINFDCVSDGDYLLFLPYQSNEKGREHEKTTTRFFLNTKE